VAGGSWTAGQTAEFLVGVWMGIIFIGLSYTGYLPGVIFYPDGALSIIAAFVAGAGYRQIGEAILGVAFVVLIVSLILVIR